jgi:predicted amidohydrolase YtcJ
MKKRGRPESITLKNGRIYRSAMDARPASAICLDGGRVSWIGETTDAPRADRVIDLNGATVLPGLTDAHIHIYAIAHARLQVSLTAADVGSLADVLRRLKDRADVTPAGGWVFATGLDENALAEQRLPLRDELDLVSPDRPLMIRRFCGHAAVINTAALHALGLHDGVGDPAGGAYGRGPDGRLDGKALESAAEAIFRGVPAFEPALLAKALRATIADCSRLGMTAAVEAAVGFTDGFVQEDTAWAFLREEQRLPLRLGFMLQIDAQDAARRGLRPQCHPDWQSISLKFFADGIVGGRTAAVSEGYLDTASRGMFVSAPEELTRVICDAHNAGWQVAVHAIGDIAIDHIISSLEHAQTRKPRSDARHRIEHYFVPPAGGLDRMKALGALVVTQPGFLKRMNRSIRRAFGDRADRYYPGRSVIDAGALYIASSDAPTGVWSPWVNMAEAVDRARAYGGPIGAQEGISNREALHSYIAGGAFAMKHEAFRGRLQTGMAADLIALDRDPTIAAPDALAQTETLMTIVRGEVVHDVLASRSLAPTS